MDLIVEKTVDEVKERLSNEATGHDWWHTYRVWQLSKRLAKAEGGDLTVIELAALLHDIADQKFHGGDETIGPKTAQAILEKFQAEESVIAQVCDIVASVSFKGANYQKNMASIEGRVVQDADRLDALGAIGIARCFAYGATADRCMYDPAIKPSPEDYQKHGSLTSINHFYEKVLRIKDLLNTKTGKQIAAKRHKYVENYLALFFREWDGQD